MKNISFFLSKNFLFLSCEIFNIFGQACFRNKNRVSEFQNRVSEFRNRVSGFRSLCALCFQRQGLRMFLSFIQEQYQLKRELFGPMRPISKEEYFGLYNSTGIEIDSRKEFVQEAVSYFADSISKLVDFAKCIPGFRELPLQDQANLIKGNPLFNLI